MFAYWFEAGLAMAAGWCLCCLVIEETYYRLGMWRWRRNKTKR